MYYSTCSVGTSFSSVDVSHQEVFVQKPMKSLLLNIVGIQELDHPVLGGLGVIASFAVLTCGQTQLNDSMDSKSEGDWVG